MSTLYLGTDAERLAEKLAAHLEQGMRAGDLLAPVRVVTPNRYLAQWLRLWLARRLGIVINLRFLYLENALWELLREVDPRQHASTPELLDHDHYRLMVLASLWEEGPELAPLTAYCQRGSAAGRAFWRRSWHLADQLARFIRDYEYHRQEALIQPWLRRDVGYPAAGASAVRLERSQLEIFQRITRLDGKRARLEELTGKVLKTLPQYAMEVMELLGPEGAHPSAAGACVHLFGVTQISDLHVRTLHWLGRHFDLRLYHLNPLTGHLGTLAKDSIQDLTQRFREFKPELLASWGQAGAESLWLAAQLLAEPCPFAAELLCAEEKQDGTVLQRVQDRLCRTSAVESSRGPQDKSLQIVACPGIYREVETVYNSILDNLNRDPKLLQTDVAVLATDLELYRPVLQAVFERQPRRLRYTLAHISAAGLSTFGQGLLGLLDLALESLTRSKVFAILLNPCVLARLGVDRTQALAWLDWAETLGIHHGWDERDKAERGYAGTPLYSWRLALQRLRLGRLMEAQDEPGTAPGPRFHDVIPFADLASGDGEQLDAFCRAVEGLLPCLVRLRRLRASGGHWSHEMQVLVRRFLDVPADRPEESQVRDRLLEALPQLAILDSLQSTGDKLLPLALVREFIADNLAAVEGCRGAPLTGGVTLAALQAVRTVPFRIIYVVGLGESLFPGSDALTTFDLRAQDRKPGDIRPAENNRFLFLETLLAARAKIYLLYNCKELQRDQDLQPSVPISQLCRDLEQHVTNERFAIVRVPLSGSAPLYLRPSPDYTDVLVNYHEPERLLALAEARRDGKLQLAAGADHELNRGLDAGRPEFAVPADSASTHVSPVNIAIADLKRFLLCPAEAAVRRHLRLTDAAEIAAGDDEPFRTGNLREYNLVTTTLARFVDRAVALGVPEALAGWRRGFTELYDEWRLRSQAPDEAFAAVDQDIIAETIQEQLTGAGGLADFLRQRAAAHFCGLVLLGESPTPVNARCRFPALHLDFGANLFVPPEVRLRGSFPLLWRTDRTFEMLVLTNKVAGKITETDLSKPLLEPLLFFLALRANADLGPDGTSAQEWLGNRTLHVHIGHAGGVACFTYPSPEIPSQVALTYLKELAKDFLNPGNFDMLPFEVIVKKSELRAAYTETTTEAAHAYAGLLQEALEADQDKQFPDYRSMELLELFELQVPSDAFEKVRRRFRLLNIGPAHNQDKGNGRSRKPH